VAYPGDGFSFTAYYRTNLRNVRTLGFQRTGNEMTPSQRLNFSGNDAGHVPSASLPLFRPTGYEYLAVNLAGVTGYYKREAYQVYTILLVFYSITIR
jgi:hypothetical protein